MAYRKSHRRMSRKAGRASRKGGLKNGRRATRKGGLKRGGLSRRVKRGGMVFPPEKEGVPHLHLPFNYGNLPNNNSQSHSL